jgi:hypothetical protein
MLQTRHRSCNGGRIVCGDIREGILVVGFFYQIQLEADSDEVIWWKSQNCFFLIRDITLAPHINGASSIFGEKGYTS